MGDGVYAGGGSLDGTVKAFMPGRSVRLSVSLVSFEIYQERKPTRTSCSGTVIH